jgi:Tfp pilus assembly protein PilF
MMFRQQSRFLTSRALMHRTGWVLMLLTLAACASPSVSPPKPAAQGLAELMERPGERSLIEGIRAYDDAQYPQAEAALRKALAAGLASARDRASAHKLLAFITCTTDRLADCEAAFRAARASDPAFTLNRSEAGHPLWGPVYRKVVQSSAN